MKIGVSSYSFGRYRRATGASLLDVCRKAKEIGFDAIEFITLDGEDHIAQAKELRALCAELGLESASDKPVREYSGGMKRRVAIARALAADYDLLLLDEPLSALDAASREATLRCIQSHCAGKTCVWVTHFPEDTRLLGCGVLRLG